MTPMGMIVPASPHSWALDEGKSVANSSSDSSASQPGSMLVSHK